MHSLRQPIALQYPRSPMHFEHEGVKPSATPQSTAHGAPSVSIFVEQLRPHSPWNVFTQYSCVYPSHFAMSSASQQLSEHVACSCRRSGSGCSHATALAAPSTSSSAFVRIWAERPTSL